MTKEFFDRYKYKILNIDQIIKISKKNKKLNKTSVMCHGVFDVVHPGHIRHLAYAKSKADILIVSLTADKHIKKGTYRPHVPQDLRALNVAVFEMVDYVIIDINQTPLINIAKIKPHYFAKGFEYTSKGLPKATLLEQKAVKKSGGEMLFTPGDVVYSSSKLLEYNLPNLNHEKLLLLMNRYKITFRILKNNLKKLKNISVHIIGDTIIDTYTRTLLIGGQTKTPTISLLYQSAENYIGGAGIVAKHLEAAGAKVNFTTVLGKDKFKIYVNSSFKKSKIKLNAIIDSKRPTTNKNVIISDTYKLLKIDTLDNTPIDNNISLKIFNNIKSIKADCVIFSDFRHGIFNKNTIPKFTSAIGNKIFKVADSQVSSRWGNISEFENFDLITPNEKEARFSLADQESNIEGLSSKLRQSANYKNLILKLGEKGILCVGNDKKNETFNLGSFSKKVIDAVGAGDALLAYSTLMLYKTKSLAQASIIGSIAASCECEIDGNVPIKIDQVLDKIDQIEKEIKYKKI